MGISIGLTRLFYVLSEQGLLSEAPAPADALVLPMTADLSPAISAATALRAAGIRAQVYAEQKKFKQKMAYADKQDIPFVLLLGEDEIGAGKVSLKDMRTGQQELLALGEATGRILQAIGQAEAVPPIRN